VVLILGAALFINGVFIEMIVKEFELDYGSMIDRTIPNGTIMIDDDGEEYIFDEGHPISVQYKDFLLGKITKSLSIKDLELIWEHSELLPGELRPTLDKIKNIIDNQCNHDYQMDDWLINSYTCIKCKDNNMFF
jgi:hypothetical protein